MPTHRIARSTSTTLARTRERRFVARFDVQAHREQHASPVVISLRRTRRIHWDALCELVARVGWLDDHGQAVRVVVSRPSVRDLLATLGVRRDLVTVRPLPAAR